MKLSPSKKLTQQKEELKLERFIRRIVMKKKEISRKRQRKVIRTGRTRKWPRKEMKSTK